MNRIRNMWAVKAVVVGTLIWTPLVLSQAPQAAPTTLSQPAATKISQIGDGARALASQDVAALERVIPNGERPWILYGEIAPTGTGEVLIEVYLPPRTTTSTLRRGSMIWVRRTAARTWIIDHGPEDYAQVAIEGRDFDNIQSAYDLNRPFRIIGRFEDSDLVSIAKSLRATQNSSELRARTLGISPGWPIADVARRPKDDSVNVNLGTKRCSGKTANLRKEGQAWIVVSTATWVC
jgi:hypothetical protein